MSKVGPCKGCTERFTACSARCPKDERGEYGYKAWKVDLEADKQYLAANKNRFLPPLSEGRTKQMERNLTYRNPHRRPGGSL